MALEHALLVALREQPASGLELARRFDRSIGFFWSATHQQIYRVLGRMEGDGWVRVETVAQQGRPDKKVYDVTAARADGARATGWPSRPRQPLRSDLAVKLRGASYGDRAAVLDVVRDASPTTTPGSTTTEQLDEARLPRPEPPWPGSTSTSTSCCAAASAWRSSGSRWLTEYLEAHQSTRSTTDESMTATPTCSSRSPSARSRCATAWSWARCTPASRTARWDLPKLAAYFAERARGGVGLIVTGGYSPNKRGWLKPFGVRDDHPAAGDAAPRGHRRGARRGRRDRAAGAARRALRLPPAQRQRVGREVADHAVQAERAVDQGRRPDRLRLRPRRSRWPRRRATTRSRSWAPRAT